MDIPAIINIHPANFNGETDSFRISTPRAVLVTGSNEPKIEPAEAPARRTPNCTNKNPAKFVANAQKIWIFHALPDRPANAS